MRKGKKRTVRSGLVILVFVMSLLFGAFTGMLTGYLRSAPSLDDVVFNPALTTYVYDINGELITTFFKENRVYVTIDKIPAHLQDAVVAVEDDQFYEHYGINVKSILRAFWVDIRGGSLQGGSTITQQLAKNAFLSHERTLVRKLRELLWTIQIERKYSKEEILETYLNEIYFGRGAYGVEAAAQTYFGKHVEDLTLAESTLLAGLARGPEYYSPFEHPDRALQRRNFVLSRMEQLEYITPAQAEAARAEPLGIIEPTSRERKARYFVEYIRQQLVNRYGEELVYGGGLSVYTSLDLKYQKAAEDSMKKLLPVIEKDSNGLTQPQGALIAIDPRNGHIKAMVGGRGEDYFNRSVLAERQPGSAIKPFIYATALQMGYTASSLLMDEPLRYDEKTAEPWPHNYDDTYDGPIPLRDALEKSKNAATVRLLREVGVKNVIDMAKRMGITTLVESGRKNDVTDAFALGGLTRGMTLKEITSAYGIFANKGILVEPIAIVKVLDKDGVVLEENRAKKNVVLSEEVSYMMTDLMRGVVERGTGKQANIGRPQAGKTGTTDNYTDAWFIGFTPELVAGVWLGYDIPKSMIQDGVKIGSWKAAQIWKEFASNALSGVPVSDFERPSTIITGLKIDSSTGKLATPDCPPETVRYENYISGTEPQEYCDIHRPEPAPRSFFDWIPGTGSSREDDQNPNPNARRQPPGL